MENFVLTQIMGKRRRKRGRPRTGHDPMVGVRLPAIFLRKIDKMAAEIGQGAVTQNVLDHKGRRGRVADRIASRGEPQGPGEAYLAARRGAKTKARRDNIIEEPPSRPRLPRTLP
jgi:hypothetical protein